MDTIFQRCMLSIKGRMVGKARICCCHYYYQEILFTFTTTTTLFKRPDLSFYRHSETQKRIWVKPMQHKQKMLDVMKNNRISNINDQNMLKIDFNIFLRIFLNIVGFQCGNQRKNLR